MPVQTGNGPHAKQDWRGNSSGVQAEDAPKAAYLAQKNAAREAPRAWARAPPGLRVGVDAVVQHQPVCSFHYHISVAAIGFTNASRSEGIVTLAVFRRG